MHLQPTDRGWLEMGLQTPIMSADRARERLQWTPRMSSVDAVIELLDGIAEGSGEATPRLEPLAK
jgi:UDP-glucose 4-epimerase